MNVSHKCRRYGLLEQSYTGRAVNQIIDVTACAIKRNLAEEIAPEEKPVLLREDLLVGIYRMQSKKESDSALYYVGETNTAAEEFDISKNFEDIKSIVFENNNNHNNLEF